MQCESKRDPAPGATAKKIVVQRERFYPAVLSPRKGLRYIRSSACWVLRPVLSGVDKFAPFGVVPAVDDRVKILPQHLQPNCVFAQPSNLVFHDAAVVLRMQVPLNEKRCAFLISRCFVTSSQLRDSDVLDDSALFFAGVSFALKNPPSPARIVCVCRLP